MHVFESNDYRNCLKKLVDHQKKLGRKVTLGDLAGACKVQKPYVSKVLNGGADFTADQLFEICVFLELPVNERDYLLLLLEYDRASSRLRRKLLKQQIDDLQKSNLKPDRGTSSTLRSINFTEESDFYLDPTLQLIHIFLGSDKYRKNLDGIAQKLNISKRRIASGMQYLLGSGFIREKGDWFELADEHTHLSSNSNLCMPHQLLVRLKSLDALQRLGLEESFRYSLTFSGNDDLVVFIKSQFLRRFRFSSGR